MFTASFIAVKQTSFKKKINKQLTQHRHKAIRLKRAASYNQVIVGEDMVPGQGRG